MLGWVDWMLEWWIGCWSGCIGCWRLEFSKFAAISICRKMTSFRVSSIWILGRGMASSTGIGVSLGRLSTIRTILSGYIRSIGCVVVGCEE